jgi:DNA polymerase III delta prime subunit
MLQERLLDSITNNRVPHAILISGPEGSGRRELARRAAALYCLGEDAPQRLKNNPNYLEIGENTVKVDDIRTLLASAAMQGFNGGRRAFVFLNAQNMSVQIQNTLLKTLEEPHEDTLLILTGNEFGLLPTIRSRCLIERLGAGSVAEAARILTREGMEEREARFFAALADGIPARAREYASPEARAFRAEAIALLERAVFVASPFADVADLITVSSAEAEIEPETDDEPKAKVGKKRKRGDVSLAISLLTIWQSLFRDAMTTQLGAGEPKNSDQTALVNRIASRFTTARIQGIIEIMAKAQQNLAGGASVYLTLDGVLARLFIKEN